MRRIIFVLIIALTTSPCYLSGQDVKATNNWFTKHPIDVALGNFSVGIRWKTGADCMGFIFRMTIHDTFLHFHDLQAFDENYLYRQNHECL